MGESKYDLKPGPNFYKINMKWNDSKNILKASASSINLNLKSVYYGWFLIDIIFLVKLMAPNNKY